MVPFPHPLEPLTETIPGPAVELYNTTIELVFCPETMEDPDGVVQL